MELRLHRSCTARGPPPLPRSHSDAARRPDSRLRRQCFDADLLCEFLRDCDLEPIGPAYQLESAEQFARVRALDGAILDISLKGQPCFPRCAILTARHIPFVFLTGYEANSKSLIPMEYWGASTISKPFEPDEMKEILAQMLGLGEGMAPSNNSRRILRH